MKKTDNVLLRDKIETHILELIRKQKLPGGFRLPAEREIGRLFKASQMPVRQATLSLINKGVLVKKPGKGTFVNADIKQTVVTNKIAVLFCHPNENFFASSFYSAILTGINQAAQEAEKVLLLQSLKKTPQDDPIRAFDELEDDVCGYILVDPTLPVVNEIRTTLKEIKKPVVVLNYEDELEGVDRIVFNTKEYIKQAVRNIRDLGHIRIGFLYYRNPLFGDEENPNLINIREGYLAGLEHSGLRFDPDLVAGMDHKDGRDEFKKMMGCSSPPSAIFLAGDLMAPAVYAMARELGLSIPGEVSIIGQGGTREGDLLQPRLSTVAFPLLEMGKMGVKILLEKSREQASSIHTTTALAGELVLKGSCKNILQTAP